MVNNTIAASTLSVSRKWSEQESGCLCCV